MTLQDIRAALDYLSEEELDQLASILTVKRMRRSQDHKRELTRKLDDRDQRNWLEEDDLIDMLGKKDTGDTKQLLAFLMSLGDNEHLRGEFVEKDDKDRNIEVSIVGGYAVYFHIEPGFNDPDGQTIRVLRIVPAK